MGEYFNETDWKLELNNLLWTNLPGDTNLREAEDLALDLLAAVQKFYEKKGLVL